MASAFNRPDLARRQAEGSTQYCHQHRDRQRCPAGPGGRSDQMVKDARPDREKVAELFVWAFGRQPSAAQMDVAMTNIERNAKSRQLAYENIIWALINTKEFILVQ